MSIRIFSLQQAIAPVANQAGPTRTEVREQVRQTIIDAQEAARAAAQGAGGGSGPNVRVIPGGAPRPPGTFSVQPDFSNAIPTQVVDISIAFFITCAVIVIGWPLARAFGKRLERRSDVAAVNPAMTDQLQRIEQAVDAMAIEIERISEAQRFMAKLQNNASAEQVALPASDRR